MHPDQAIAARGGKLDILHVQQLIRLLDEAREIPAAGPERERHLVTGVARIVGAALAGSVLEGVSTFAASKPPGDMFAPLVHSVMRITPVEPGVPITVTSNDLVVDRQRDLTDASHRHPAGAREAIVSSVRLWMSRGVHALALYRELEDPGFSDDECNIVPVFHAACANLLHAPTLREPVAAVRDNLSPRQRQTLALVLRGLSDKEIANNLGISCYTVNQYTKAIYRHYAVSSRAQLLARQLEQRQSTLPNHRELTSCDVRYRV